MVGILRHRETAPVVLELGKGEFGRIETDAPGAAAAGDVLTIEIHDP